MKCHGGIDHPERFYKFKHNIWISEETKSRS